MANYDLIPIERRPEWIQHHFGINQDSFGLTKEAADRLTFTRLTATLHRLMEPPQEGQKNGIRLLENQLEIAEVLRSRLQDAIWPDTQNRRQTETDTQDAREFTDAWLVAREIVAGWRAGGNDPEIEMRPPAGDRD